MSNIYYVYAYLRDDFTPYYIGKGKENRAYDKKYRITKPPTDTSKIVFLYKNLTEQEAFIIEQDYISILGRKDNKTGILRNLTDGGEGLANPSFKTIEKMRKSALGNSYGSFNKGKKHKKHNYTYKFTEEHKRKLSEKSKCRVPWNKGIKISSYVSEGS
jgi:hypothetical protein